MLSTHATIVGLTAQYVGNSVTFFLTVFNLCLQNPQRRGPTVPPFIFYVLFLKPVKQMLPIPDGSYGIF